MIVLPSDHYVEGEKEFNDTIKQAIDIVERRRGLVTIGIKPTRPEMGYGYIKMGSRLVSSVPTFKVDRFTEKPNIEVAKDFLMKNTYLWNSGMFVWRADVYLREVQKYLPKMYKSLMEIYQNLDTPKETETIRTQYNLIEGISVDFGIMQKTRKAYVIKAEFVWDDIGNFNSLSRFLGNFRGNNVSGITFVDQSENCCIFGDKKLIIGFGIKDLVIVDSDDVLLVMDKNKDQELKYLVEEIKEKEDLREYL